jgi:glutamate formiminotransferase/formiminotetrahydrofolate cyclodeaminase
MYTQLDAARSFARRVQTATGWSFDRAFDRVMAAIAMPRSTDAEKASRSGSLAAANLGALKVPFEVMQTAYKSFDLIHAMAEQGNPASASDAGVGALCTRAAVRGAWLNVQTNSGGIKDKTAIAPILADGAKLVEDSATREAEILAIVEQKFGA